MSNWLVIEIDNSRRNQEISVVGQAPTKKEAEQARRRRHFDNWLEHGPWVAGSSITTHVVKGEL